MHTLHTCQKLQKAPLVVSETTGNAADTQADAHTCLVSHWFSQTGEEVNIQALPFGICNRLSSCLFQMPCLVLLWMLENQRICLEDISVFRKNSKRHCSLCSTLDLFWICTLLQYLNKQKITFSMCILKDQVSLLKAIDANVCKDIISSWGFTLAEDMTHFPARNPNAANTLWCLQLPHNRQGDDEAKICWNWH